MDERKPCRYIVTTDKNTYNFESNYEEYNNIAKRVLARGDTLYSISCFSTSTDKKISEKDYR